MWNGKKLTFAEKQKRYEKTKKILEYVLPLIVSAITATVLSIWLLT